MSQETQEILQKKVDKIKRELDAFMNEFKNERFWNATVEIKDASDTMEELLDVSDALIKAGMKAQVEKNKTEAGNRK